MEMNNYSWKIKGLCLSAPATNEIDLICNFIDKKLAPAGINLLVLLTRYRYQFVNHPECRGNDPLSESDVKSIANVCRKNKIRLVPKMNLLGHQSGKTRDSLDGLLKGHPEFDETPEVDEVYYCRSLCPNHPHVKDVVFSLMEEMLDAFEADALHIGCDEVFDIGKCPRCKDIPTAALFADWINTLHDYLKSKGADTFMWGDRLLNGNETGFGSWEASTNATDDAIDKISKDIIICDWHYEDCPSYKSVNVLTQAGYKILLTPWRHKANALKFIDYAKLNDNGNILGVLESTWSDAGDLARYMLDGKEPKNEITKLVADTINTLFIR